MRRVPQQQRSRDLVTSVVDAAERLLAEDDPAHPGALTTTRIARAAGIAVGSLYQYFPDTAAVLAAVADRHLTAFEALMDQAARAAREERWDDPVGVLVDLFAARWREEPGYRALWLGVGLAPELLEADRANKRALARGVRRVLVAQGLAHDGPHLVTVSEAAVIAADALLQEAFRRDPAGDPTLLDELKTILRGHLATLAPADSGRPS
jgi:AcrR family transcriptional regulator